MSAFDWENYISISWTLTLNLPNGLSVENDFAIIDFEIALAEARGMIKVLKLLLDVDASYWNGKKGPGRRYTAGAEGFEYITIYCKQGAGLVLKEGNQIGVGTFVDYICAGYRWDIQIEGKRGIRFIDKETIYRDWWITGNSFYMTNDSKLDSVNLSPISRDRLIEFVPLPKTVEEMVE